MGHSHIQHSGPCIECALSIPRVHNEKPRGDGGEKEVCDLHMRVVPAEKRTPAVYAVQCNLLHHHYYRYVTYHCTAHVVASMCHLPRTCHSCSISVYYVATSAHRLMEGYGISCSVVSLSSSPSCVLKSDYPYKFNPSRKYSLHSGVRRYF